MRKLILASLLAAVPLIPATASADPTPEELNVKARQGFFEMLSLNMGPLAAMAKGDLPYDEATAVLHASNIESLTRYYLPIHFVPGTSTDDMENTGALPKIWNDLDGVKEKFAGLQQAAVGVGEAVKGGQQNVGPVVQQLGGACKACHDNYRKK